MPPTTSIPTRAAVRDLLADLIRRRVIVAEATPQVLDVSQPARAAIYRHDDGRVAAVCVLDHAVAAACGSGLGGLLAVDGGPVDDAGPPGELDELVHEVVNVLAKVLNGPAAPHVALREVRRLPGGVAPDAAAVLLGPRDRVDYQVRVEGCEPGIATFLTA